MKKGKNIVWRMPYKRCMKPCEEDISTCGAEQVLVKIEYCGVCGSDLRFYKEGAIGTRQAPKDFILGHESAGTVIEVGEAVTELHIGDRVALEPGIPCGGCEYCRNGKYNLCPKVQFLAAARPATDGALRQYMAYPAKWCYKLPENVSTLEGCMIEPLAVGLHAARRGETGFGKSVLIIGAGTIGFMTLLAVKAMGASKIIICDVQEERLDKAGKAGAQITVNSQKKDLEKLVLEETHGQGCDIVFECSGNSQCFADTWKYVKPGGVIVNVANAGGDIPYRFDELSRKEADIRSVWRYRHLYPAAIEAVENGSIDLKQIEPMIFSYEQCMEAFEYASTQKVLPLKIVIQITERESR